MASTTRIMAACVGLMAGFVLSGMESVAAVTADFDLQVDKSGQITLTATHLSVAEVLDRMATRLDWVWHGSGLPRTPVSVVCRGETLAPVLACLLDGSGSCLIRHAPQAPAQVREVWIVAPAAVHPPPLSPAQRASRLAHWLEPYDLEPALRERRVSEGLQDPNPQVRVQAVYGLARYDPQRALAIGLADTDSSVRLMAVENAGISPTDQSLLQNALADSDETVRTLAALKLDALPGSGPGARPNWAPIDVMGMVKGER